MATVLDYKFHYPLSPIQSASHNIHPAFRNDPEFADVINIGENLSKSTATLVPPPRNPLRLAVKPLFSTSITEVNPSSRPDSPEFRTPQSPGVVTPDSPISPQSSPSSATSTTSSSSNHYPHKEIHDSDPLPPYQNFDSPNPALNSPKPVSRMCGWGLRMGRGRRRRGGGGGKELY